MLNAVALLFILEIDDLLYKAGLEWTCWNKCPKYSGLLDVHWHQVLAPKHAMQFLSSIRHLVTFELNNLLLRRFGILQQTRGNELATERHA